MIDISQPLTIDEIIDKALDLCRALPPGRDYDARRENIADLRERLAGGRLRIAVLGQFNRGKSSFINALLRMPILPVSVLPITSVPTTIAFGEKNTCAITFSNGAQEIVTEGDSAQIHSYLSKYVTEKNNPKNYLCVAKVIVTCRSVFLQHGTILIDTPGFGSTLTHNTQTTIDLLQSCDAALFLLSADILITQTEVDFLKKVVPNVPKIFFIYNKIDLLKEDELKTTTKFITDALTKQLGLYSAIELFPVSVKIAQNIRKDPGVWEKSGFKAVDREIISFLRREKYFTLSEALTAKFKDAVDQIIIFLKNKYTSISAPVDQMQIVCSNMKKLIDTVQTEAVKSAELSLVEKNALLNYSRKQIGQKSDYMHTQAKKKVRDLCASLASANTIPLLHTVIQHGIEELFGTLYASVISRLLTPQHNAGQAHIRELKRLAKTIREECDDTILAEDTYSGRTDLLMIDAMAEFKTTAAAGLKPPAKSSVSALFLSVDKRVASVVGHYSTQLGPCVDRGIEELTAYIDSLITQSFEKFILQIKNDYTEMADLVKKKLEEKEIASSLALEKIAPELHVVNTLIRDFEDVRRLLL